MKTERQDEGAKDVSLGKSLHSEGVCRKKRQVNVRAAGPGGQAPGPAEKGLLRKPRGQGRSSASPPPLC